MIALPCDLRRRLQPADSLLRLELGIQPFPDARRVALYAHYSGSGQVSQMVLIQLEQLAELGFAVVFISAAAQIPEEHWQAARQSCAIVVQRRNFGLDFGAWKDLLPEVRRRWSVPDELMLANDSVLGPIHPLGPVIETMRAGQDGLFGLTENLEGGAHLQSYMLLGQGRAAVVDLMRFVQKLRVGHSKWLLIEMGEIRLARWMRRRGHRVGAVFGYERLVRAVVADVSERQRLMASHARLAGLDRLSEAEASRRLYLWPLSPVHHMWHILATRFGAPFLKTEMVLRNPWRIQEAANWATVVPRNAPTPVPVIQAHLTMMKAD